MGDGADEALEREEVHWLEEEQVFGDPACEVCHTDPHDCSCPECPNCVAHGDPECKVNGGQGCKGQYIGLGNGQPVYRPRQLNG